MAATSVQRTTMTARQREVYQAIKTHVEMTGSAPSYRTLAAILGITSAASVQKHIKAIERRGLIKRVRPDGQAMLLQLGDFEPCSIARRVSPFISPRLRWQIWERDDFRCLACGVRQLLVVDHVIPWVAGGATEPHNLQTLCSACNTRKARNTYDYRNQLN